MRLVVIDADILEKEMKEVREESEGRLSYIQQLNHLNYNHHQTLISQASAVSAWMTYQRVLNMAKDFDTVIKEGK